MSTAARRHTISNTTQPVDAAMAVIGEDMEGAISGGGGVVVFGSGVVVLSGG